MVYFYEIIKQAFVITLRLCGLLVCDSTYILELYLVKQKHCTISAEGTGHLLEQPVFLIPFV